MNRLAPRALLIAFILCLAPALVSAQDDKPSTDTWDSAQTGDAPAPETGNPTESSSSAQSTVVPAPPADTGAAGTWDSVHAGETTKPATTYPQTYGSSTSVEHHEPGPKFGVGFMYNIGTPIGSMRDFTSDTSFRGFGFDFRYFLSERLSVGAMSGWQRFDDKVHATVTQGPATLTSTQLRAFETVPVLAQAHYYLPLSMESLSLFAGLGIGTYWTRRDVNTGIFSSRDDNWHFGLAPEVGALYQIGQVKLAFSFKLNYILEASAKDDLFLGFNLGVLSGI